MTTLDRFAPIFSHPISGDDAAGESITSSTPTTTTTTTPAPPPPPKLKRARTVGREARKRNTKPGTMIKSYRYPLDEASAALSKEGSGDVGHEGTVYPYSASSAPSPNVRTAATAITVALSGILLLVAVLVKM